MPHHWGLSRQNTRVDQLLVGMLFIVLETLQSTESFKKNVYFMIYVIIVIDARVLSESELQKKKEEN